MDEIGTRTVGTQASFLSDLQAELYKNNPMTKEHIQPLFLGGFERGDNIDAICKSCNTARNNVMIDVFATTDLSAIRRRMPAMKPAIESLVVWYIASLSGDREALAETDAYTIHFSNTVKLAIRLRTWAIKPSKPDQSAWSRLKNWTKVNSGKGEMKPNKKFQLHEFQTGHFQSKLKTTKLLSMTMDEFNKLVVILIGSDEIGPGELGQRHQISEWKRLVLCRKGSHDDRPRCGQAHKVSSFDS